MGPPTDFQPPMTPALVVRKAALEQNLAAMQGLCDAAGVRLRAHGKMHKCSTLGRRQVELGAVGLCCQTVGEAETFAAAGIADLLITSPPGAWGAARIAAIAKGGTRIAVVADDEIQIARLSKAAAEAGVTVGLVVDIDLGTHRTGVPPEQVAALAKVAAGSPGLEYRGIQAYLGHLQHMAELDERRAACAVTRQRLGALVGELTEAGLKPGVVTGGGTGTYSEDLASGVFTELQAGSYAFMDVEYEDCGAPDGQAWAFSQALFLAASVVSARHKTHAVCDLGLKAHSVDGPPARIAAGAPSGARWRPMGDEHGAIFHPQMMGVLRAAGSGPLAFASAISQTDEDAAIAWPTDAPKVGDIVWLQPGHIDPTINLYDAMYVVDEAGGVEVWPIDARRTAR
ncbi:MAG: alanine racemase [Pseudomonadota bacterium]|uniref:alanine racemase n=1 Tax=unclassified Phenylobacterium TaxID=2640670 RepID=UPI0006FB5E06|nr:MULTISPECIES: alanine racemase [unclassified Phenylobacterium]KRB52431.1 threonine aldolase [Phenylobacterium sp. Root700]MBT9473822.1 alanine racemase [Phenylobacterium sp.]